MMNIKFENNKSRQSYLLLNLGEQIQTHELPPRCVAIYKECLGEKIYVRECKDFFDNFTMTK